MKKAALGPVDFSIGFVGFFCWREESSGGPAVAE